jgi:hypothetical protein
VGAKAGSGTVLSDSYPVTNPMLHDSMRRAIQCRTVIGQKIPCSAALAFRGAAGPCPMHDLYGFARVPPVRTMGMQAKDKKVLFYYYAEKSSDWSQQRELIAQKYFDNGKYKIVFLII